MAFDGAQGKRGFLEVPNNQTLGRTGVLGHICLKVPVSIALSLFLSLLVLTPRVAAQVPDPAGEILSIVGKGEFRDPQQTNWRQAGEGQKLKSSQFVRTGDASKMGLLFADKTQMRLGQNSMMQLVLASNTKDQKTTIDLRQGRTWMQSKTTPGGLEVRTPSALAAIRGTDWELVVDADGKTTLSVFSGQVDISNAAGAVSVARNEQATVEIGKAPVKTILVNPADRIQWVSSFTIDPARYVETAALKGSGNTTALAKAVNAIADGRSDIATSLLTKLAQTSDTDSAVARLLLADCLIYDGNVVQADTVLKDGLARFPKDERLAVARARLALQRGDAATARSHAAAAKVIGGTAEVAILEGEIAAFNGEASAARTAFERAVTLAPKDARPVAGLGRVEAERQEIGKARLLFTRALSLSPTDANTLGYVGENETNAGEVADALVAFDKALAIDSSNYVVRTARAALRLRQGRDEDALDELLRATVIEPRYAKAHVMLAIAYYRMERIERALETLERAKALDPNDPFAYQVASVIRSDVWQPNRAVSESLGAMLRLPFLKSLNQFAEDQKGSANLGAALAVIGLEAWAQQLAQDSYQPLWAGSHLFLADRYAGDYAKHSELMQGFLLDPLVFGASNRYQSIMMRPESNATLQYRFSRNSELSIYEPVVTANGLTRTDRPLAFFAEAIDTRIRPGHSAISGTGKTYTAGFGARPSWDKGVFIYLNRVEANVDFGRRTADGEFQRIGATATRADLAGMVAFDGTTQLWAKTGYGRDTGSADTSTRSSNPIFPGLIAQRDSSFAETAKSTDAQIRATRVWAGRNNVFAGIEWAKTSKPQTLVQDTFSHLPGVTVPRSNLKIDDELRSTYVYSGVQLEKDHMQWHALVSHTSFEQPRRLTSIGPMPTAFRFDFDERLTRRRAAGEIGMVMRVEGGTTLRGSCGRWVRPAASGTLSPVAMGGTVIDDQLVFAGGQSDRCHLRVEQTLYSKAFLSIAYDTQRVDNLVSVIDGVANSNAEASNLNRLRNRIAAPNLNFNEFEDSPVFGVARIKRVQINIEQLLPGNFAARLGYTHAASDNLGEGFRGNMVPYLPKSQVSVGFSWALAGHGIFTVGPVYRSRRFADESNLIPVAAGWDTEVTTFWEWDRKRWSVEAFVQNLAKKQTVRTSGVNLSYRF